MLSTWGTRADAPFSVPRDLPLQALDIGEFMNDPKYLPFLQKVGLLPYFAAGFAGAPARQPSAPPFRLAAPACRLTVPPLPATNV